MGAVAATSGIASAETGKETKTTIKAESEPASRNEVREALRSEPAQDIVTSIEHPSARGNGNGGKRLSLQLEQSTLNTVVATIDDGRSTEREILFEVFRIPTNIGTLGVIFNDDVATRATLNLNQSGRVKPYLLNTVGNIGFSPSLEAGLESQGNGTMFFREVKKPLKQKVVAAIDRKQEPDSVTIYSRENERIVAKYSDKIYVLNTTADEILSTVDQDGSSGGIGILATSKCEKQGAYCLVDASTVLLDCRLSQYTCSIAISTGGGAGVTALACIAAFVGFCGPSLLLAAAGGSCTYVVRNCI